MGWPIREFLSPALLGLGALIALSGCTPKATDGTPATTATQPPTPVAVQVASIAPPPPVSRGTAVETEVSLEEEGGTFVVPVMINDTLSLKFTLDSGAADVNVPADVVSTLVRSGTITRDDFIGAKTFVLADGTEVPSAEFRIRSLKIGTLVLHDVTASIGDPRGSLLLGQSFLTRLSNWSIDNGQHLLRLKAADAHVAVSTPVDVPVSEATAYARNAPPSDTADGLTESAQEDASRIAQSYFATWSDPGDPTGAAIRKFYAKAIKFYGKAIGVDELMEQKLAFARRWPNRHYVARPSSVVVQCSDAHKCNVSGVVDWNASDIASGRRAAGVAAFSMGLQDGLIDAEAGHVLARS